jgi:outer membrane receptor protein involved in Fe transport
VSGGNPNLDVETAETVTVGVVLQPSFIEGFSITLDYWDIEIQDAISAVGATQILQGCFDSPNFPNLGFCDQFTRRADGGLNSLETGQINFARQEARGIDFAVYYDFTVGENEFNVKLVGSRQDRLDFYFNPLDDNDVDPELEEVRLPELTANFTIGWQRGPLSLSLQTLYQSRQAVDEIEDVLGLAGNQALYGANGFFGETYVFDINGSYEINEGLSVYGGINNITDEEPFATQTAWPVGPRGRTFFVGISYRN